MATINPIVNKAVQGANSVVTASWTMGGADTGVQVALTDWYDRSIQIAGTFGGATVTIQGSNDGVNWSTMRDPASVALTFTAADIKQLLEMALYIRPITTGGTGSALVVTMAGRQLIPMSWS
jgi:hypothetical protein